MSVRRGRRPAGAWLAALASPSGAMILWSEAVALTVTVTAKCPRVTAVEARFRSWFGGGRLATGRSSEVTELAGADRSRMSCTPASVCVTCSGGGDPTGSPPPRGVGRATCGSGYLYVMSAVVNLQ